MRQIVDPDGLLKTGNAVCHFFKAVFAKELMFFLLEILCHCVVLMSRHENSQQRKQVRIRECQHGKSFRSISEANIDEMHTLETLVSAIKGIFERPRLLLASMWQPPLPWSVP